MQENSVLIEEFTLLCKSKSHLLKIITSSIGSDCVCLGVVGGSHMFSGLYFSRKSCRGLFRSDFSGLPRSSFTLS